MTHQTGHLNFLILLNLLFLLLIIFHNLHSLRLHKLIFLNVELFLLPSCLFCFLLDFVNKSHPVLNQLLLVGITERKDADEQPGEESCCHFRPPLFCCATYFTCASMCKAHGNYNLTSYSHFIKEEIEDPRNEKISLVMQLEDGGPMLKI